jgi:signal transduction histidine kinase/CheY-like chemotaxis protein
LQRHTLVLVVAFLLAAVAPCQAQDPPHWRVFTSTDGLRESWVEDVSQTPDGRVLVTHGAVDAHTVYDGYTFQHLPAAGAPLKLRAAPNGQLWTLLPGSITGNDSGLQFYDGTRWTRFPLAGLRHAPQRRWHFLPWKPDRVLLLTPDALLEFDRVTRELRVVCRGGEVGLARFTDLAPAADGGAWVGGPGGLVHGAATAGEPRRFVALDAPWRDHSVLRIHDAAGRLFAAVGNDRPTVALAFEGERWREVGRATEPTQSVEAWPGRAGAIWVAEISPRGFRLTLTEGACCRRTLERTKAFSSRLHAVEPLADGGFWLATSLGLVRHAPAAWHSPPELASVVGTAGALLEATNGDLYALHDRGLLRYHEARWTLQTLPAGFLVDAGLTMNLAELPGGRIAFGANRQNGVAVDTTFVFDPVRSSFSEVAHPAGRSVRMLGPAAPFGAWVVTREARHFRLERYDGARFTERLDAQSSWLAAVPRTVIELGGGDLVLVPEGEGVGLLRGGRHEVIGRAQGYPGSGSFAAYALDSRNFWFGDRDGVLSFDGTRWQRVRTGLQTVRAITGTRDGSIWVTSGSGLHRHRDGGWTTIGAPEGLPDGSVNDLLEARSGAIWVSTTNGLSRYVAEADRDPPQTSLDLPGNPTQAPPSGDVRIVFNGRDRWSYSPPERLLFAWRLDNGPWSPPEPREAVPFSALAPGRHRIDVRAADRNWNVDATPATHTFVVLLPWYRESGFLAVGALGSLALLLAAGSFVWRHVRLERLVGERTRALGEANAQLRAELADRRRIEEDRARLEGQLHQAQKLEAVGRLAGGIAHDFNNLLTVITGFAELAKDDTTTSPSARASIDEIADAAQRASGLTRQVLAFSRQQVVEPMALDLNAIVADIERMLHRLIGEDITLVFRPGAQLWPVLADRGQLEQVLVNLAVNARDAMPQGGHLTLETANVELDDAFTRAHAGTRPGPHVRLTVADTGVGMDAETRARIFEPFFTTKAKEKGTGLGLATVYGVVAQASGHVWVESEPGRGTTFTIYLPRTGLPAVERTTDPSDAPGGSERILIVEDDDAVRHVAAMALQRLGYAVDVCASAEAALDRLRDGTDAPDLVLTDIVLKGMSGVDLASHARRARPTLRVLFMSGYADSALLRRGPIQGGSHFIQKPFTAAALGRKVRDAIDALPPA